MTTMNKLQRHAIALPVLTAALLLSGCVSTVNVQKASTAKGAGIHYFLPQVFIKVTPTTDGNLTVEKLFLADPAQEYVISANSFLGSYTIDVNRTEVGLLESVSFNSDSSAIPKALAASLGNVRSADIDDKVAREKAAATEAKAAADKARTALEAADKARKDAQTTLTIAQAKFQLLDSLAQLPGASNDVKNQALAAQLAIIDAQAKYNAAEQAYNTLAANVADAVNLKGANGVATARPVAPTPAFYKVEMSTDSVVLREAFAQRDLQTYTVPTAASAPPDPLTAFPTEQVVRPDAKTKALIATVGVNLPLVSAKALRLALVGDNGPGLPLPTVSSQPDRATLIVELPQDLKNGTYDLDIDVLTGKPAKPAKGTLGLKVKVVR